MSCWRCKDGGILDGDRHDGPDARWCDCAAAYERMETRVTTADGRQVDLVTQINEARAVIRERFGSRDPLHANRVRDRRAEPRQMQPVGEIEDYKGEF